MHVTDILILYQTKKTLDKSKLKALADDKINVTKKVEICFGKGRKHCGKRRKCWFPAFSPFPAMFSKGFYPWGTKSRECAVKSCSSTKLTLTHCMPRIVSGARSKCQVKHRSGWIVQLPCSQCNAHKKTCYHSVAFQPLWMPLSNLEGHIDFPPCSYLENYVHVLSILRRYHTILSLTLYHTISTSNDL